MADVTINQLTGQAPTSTDIFPFSTTGVTPSTYKATLAQIKTGLGLATVASTGSYNDLSSKPTIPTATSQLTNDSGFMSTSQTGSAPYFGIRAYVNFDGGSQGATASPLTIRSQGNVSSVIRPPGFNTGIYQVNFTTAMPNTNYVIHVTTTLYDPNNASVHPRIYGNYNGPFNKTASYCWVTCSNNSPYNMGDINVIIIG